MRNLCTPKAERNRDRGSWCDCDASVKESDFSVGGKLREFMKKARGGRQSFRESRSVRH